MNCLLPFLSFNTNALFLNINNTKYAYLKIRIIAVWISHNAATINNERTPTTAK